MFGDESSVRFSAVGNGGLYRLDLRVRRDFSRDAGRVGTLVRGASNLLWQCLT